MKMFITGHEAIKVSGSVININFTNKYLVKLICKLPFPIFAKMVSLGGILLQENI